VSELEATMHPGHSGVMEESPYGIPSGKLAMWCFVLSDAVTFSAILFAYGYLRIGSSDWTRPFCGSALAVGHLRARRALRRSAPLGMAPHV